MARAAPPRLPPGLRRASCRGHLGLPPPATPGRPGAGGEAGEARDPGAPAALDDEGGGLGGGEAGALLQRPGLAEAGGARAAGAGPLDAGLLAPNQQLLTLQDAQLAFLAAAGVDIDAEAEVRAREEHLGIDATGMPCPSAYRLTPLRQ